MMEHIKDCKLLLLLVLIHWLYFSEQAILKIAQAYARSTDGELDSLLESTEHLLRRTEEEYIILITDKMHTVFQNCQKKGLDQLKSTNERLVSLIVNNTSVSPKVGILKFSYFLSCFSL